MLYNIPKTLDYKITPKVIGQVYIVILSTWVSLPHSFICTSPSMAYFIYKQAVFTDTGYSHGKEFMYYLSNQDHEENVWLLTFLTGSGRSLKLTDLGRSLN